MSLHVQGMIDELIDRIAFPTTNNAGHRAQLLRQLNNSERWISQQGSFLYLQQRVTLALAHLATTVAAPTNPQLDSLKTATIAGDYGPLVYYPTGEFDEMAMDQTNAIRTTQPSSWTLAMSGTVLTIFFDRQNQSGGLITYTFAYQRTPIDLVDLNSSFSLLPEGYERTLLMDRAEREIKRILRIPIEPWKLSEFEESMQAFASSQRTTKPEATTDAEIAAKKQYEVQLAPGR